METEDGGIFLQAVSHSSPKHHRTSSLLDSPGSASASNSFSGGVDSSLPVGQNGSYDGGMKKPASGTAGMTLELPEFASMLPLECSFSESAADDAAAAPTPHTPVVLSVFEGEGLKVATSRATHIWEHHQETDDEFEACFHDTMSQNRATPHDWQSSEHSMQAEIWLDAQFPSLLNRRTLSAVMEGEHEGQDEEGHEQRQQEQQSDVQQEQRLCLQQLGDTTFLLGERMPTENGTSNSSIHARLQTGAACTNNDELDEADVQLELSSSSVIIYPDRQEQRQQQVAQVNGMQQLQPCLQPMLQPHQQAAATVEQQEQQQQQQQPLQADGAMPGSSQGLETMESADSLPAVECRINSRHSIDVGKCNAAADAEGEAGAEGAEDEWQQANKQRLQEQQAYKAADALASSPLTYPAAETQLLAADMRCHRAAVLQSLPRPPGLLARNFQQLFSCGSCSSSSSMVALEGTSEQEQVVLLLSLAKTALSDANEVHVGMLQAVYSAYSGKPGPVSRFGAHWCEVGFQGDDPATDLRGVGMLGLLQLLYLPHHNATAAQRLYQLSISVVQEFPLAVVGLNITRWALTAIRAGSLTRAAHRLGSYMAAANHFYCGAFYEFYGRWCQGKTMREAGFVLKHLEEYCRKHPIQLLKLAAAPDRALAAADSKAWQPS